MSIRGNRQRHYTLHPDPSVKSFWDYGQQDGEDLESDHIEVPTILTEYDDEQE